MADRDVEVVKSRAKFVATLRRVADAIEQREAVRIQVAGKRVVVPLSARLSIEHELEGRDAELELQLSWKAQPSARKPAAAKRKTSARKRKSVAKKR